MTLLTCNIGQGVDHLLMKVDLDESRINEKAILDFLLGGQLYEPDIAHILGRVLRKGDVVIDVGANIGFFTVLASILVSNRISSSRSCTRTAWQRWAAARKACVASSRAWANRPSA
jgi:hypothetical protein